jgi:hypothetical protein
MSPRQKGQQRHTEGHDSGKVAAELARLPSLDLEGLRSEWMTQFGTQPPPVRSRKILRQLIAWQLQADAFGGLDAKTERLLQSIAIQLERDGTYEPKTRRDLAPGIELTREWKGTIHRVTVATDGFQYLGKSYASLSDIARTITGTRWSGPRFFGLEQKSKRKIAEHRTKTIALSAAIGELA